jgi:hypothetical protein
MGKTCFGRLKFDQQKKADRGIPSFEAPYRNLHVTAFGLALARILTKSNQSLSGIIFTWFYDMVYIPRFDPKT